MPVTRDPEDHGRIASAQLTQNDGRIPLPGLSREEPTPHPGRGDGTVADPEARPQTAVEYP